MNRILSLLCGLAIICVASTTQAQIEWAAGAPGGTSGGSIQLGAGDGVFLATGISAAQIAPTSGADYTISAWINSTEANAAGNAVANRWWLGTGNQGLHLGVQTTASGLTSGHWGNDSSGATSVPANTWVHATHVYRSGVHEIYMDGVLQTLGSGGAVGAPNNDSTDIIIGSRNGTQVPGPSWGGFIDDVAMFTSALSASDIATLAGDSSQAVALGAVAYYDFEDDQTGTTAAVAGSLGNALAGIGAPLPPLASWAMGAPEGTSGGSLEFDGVGSNVISTGIASQLIGGSRGGGSLGSDYSVSMWINSSEPDVNGNATSNRWFFGTGDQGLHLGIQGADDNPLNGAAGTLELGHWGADTSGTTAVQAGTWVHATFPFDADGGTNAVGEVTGLHSLYLNGVLDASAPQISPNRAITDLQIGGRNGGGGPAWLGLIDDVAIFDTVLSATDVSILAADTTQAVGLGAVAYYDFEDDQSGSTALNLVDVATSGLTGTSGLPAFQMLDRIGPSNLIKADVNLDGYVTFFDIQPFIDVLSSSTFQAEADCNCDGVVDFFDGQPFIDILSGS